MSFGASVNTGNTTRNIEVGRYELWLTLVKHQNIPCSFHSSFVQHRRYTDKHRVLPLPVSFKIGDTPRNIVFCHVQFRLKREIQRKTWCYVVASLVYTGDTSYSAQTTLINTDNSPTSIVLCRFQLLLTPATQRKHNVLSFSASFTMGIHQQTPCYVVASFVEHRQYTDKHHVLSFRPRLRWGYTDNHSGRLLPALSNTGDTPTNGVFFCYQLRSTLAIHWQTSCYVISRFF